MKTMYRILFAAVIMASVFSCTTSEAPARNESEPDENSFSVKVQELEKMSIPRALEYTANLHAFTEIHYAPASPGRINNIHVEVGSRIKKGEVLVEMDRTQLQQALTQLENARSNFKRLDTLNNLGSISEQQYEQVKTQYELALSNVEFLEENTRLVSPVNGIVTGKYFEDGEFYSGAPNTQAGKAAVLSLMQIDPLKALVSISQRFFPDIKEGMEASITSDIYPEKTFRGRVFRIHPTIDPATRTFQIEISVDNPGELLRPGMFSKISLSMEPAEALVVPAIAVLKQEGTNNRYVFLEEEGKAKKVEVAIVDRYNESLVIESPEITEGARLIVAGQSKLMEGSLVEIIPN